MTAATMLAEARKDLGMSGRPNPITRDYASRNGSEFLRAPWCDMSITHWARQSGNADAVLPEGDRAFTVWHAEDGKDLGRWYPGTSENIRKHAKPGAVVFFDWDGTDRIGAIDHVGIVEVNLGDGRVQTIEGNTADSCKRRVRASNVIAGFWNPDYEEDDDVSAKDLWEHELKVPYGSEENPSWQAGNVLVNHGNWLRKISGQLDAQAETIKTLAAFIAEGHSEVDVDALMARIEEAIERVTVRLDVTP
ncbi:CHAP domain-containing protein [Nonomuraea sp. bgisy101]|uniref:CHAP domain-containing protein n=1 Tax=Nonomuraea sp. bgisy101 TaxID=3413784 RepID=UPI003D715299